jgi:hypothetical protein
VSVNATRSWPTTSLLMVWVSLAGTSRKRATSASRPLDATRRAGGRPDALADRLDVLGEQGAEGVVIL